MTGIGMRKSKSIHPTLMAAFRPGVDDVLDSARQLLLLGRGGLALVPIPGLSLVASALIQLIDTVKVRAVVHGGSYTH